MEFFRSIDYEIFPLDYRVISGPFLFQFSYVWRCQIDQKQFNSFFYSFLFPKPISITATEYHFEWKKNEIQSFWVRLNQYIPLKIQWCHDWIIKEWILSSNLLESSTESVHFDNEFLRIRFHHGVRIFTESTFQNALDFEYDSIAKSIYLFVNIRSNAYFLEIIQLMNQLYWLPLPRVKRGKHFVIEYSVPETQIIDWDFLFYSLFRMESIQLQWSLTGISEKIPFDFFLNKMKPSLCFPLPITFNGRKGWIKKRESSHI